MAEVIAPIGFAFGALGFIFSTVGTVTEKWEDFHRYEEQMGLYQLRLGNLEQKFNKWNIFWKTKDWGHLRPIIDAAIGRIWKLLEEMEQKLQRYHLGDVSLWSMLFNHWREGKRPKMRDLGSSSAIVFHKFAYSLWKKKKLEGWMNRLKDEVEAIDSHSKREIKRRTANFASSDPSQEEIRRTRNLEEFVGSLTTFAQQLHDHCTNTPATSGWALGLRPPKGSKDEIRELGHYARDVKAWSHIARINIELVYSLTEQTVKEGRLRVGHHCIAAQPQLPSHDQIKGGTPTDYSTINCSILDEPRVRTRSLGKLIEEGFFDNLNVRKAWQQDCARLLGGISNWTLFLWKTSWTHELCCYGLQIEQVVPAQNCYMQLFTANSHHDQCCHHPWRLRNLGLVLAQLALATSFRCKGELQGLELEQWIDASWSPIYVQDILDKLLDRPNTDKIRNVIDFCLTDESPLARESFQPSFLFNCIDSIHKNIMEWCDVELADPSFYKDLNEISGNSPWPGDAYEKLQKAGSNAVPTPYSNDPNESPQQARDYRPGEAQQPHRLHQAMNVPGLEGLPQQGNESNQGPRPEGLRQNLELRPASTLKRRQSMEPEPENNKRIKQCEMQQ